MRGDHLHYESEKCEAKLMRLFRRGLISYSQFLYYASKMPSLLKVSQDHENL